METKNKERDWKGINTVMMTIKERIKNVKEEEKFQKRPSFLIVEKIPVIKWKTAVRIMNILKEISQMTLQTGIKLV